MIPHFIPGLACLLSGAKTVTPAHNKGATLDISKASGTVLIEKSKNKNK